MQASISWGVLSLSWLFLVALVTKFFFSQLHKRNLKFPPGPKPWPIIGNLNLINGPLPHRSLHKLSQTYGSLMQLKFGSYPVVVASSAEMAKQFLKTHDHVFASRPRTAAGWTEMEKMRQWGWLLGSFTALLVLVLFLAGDGSYDETTSPVRRSLRNILPWQQQGVSLLARNRNRVALDNGIVKVIFSNPGGNLIGVRYRGIDMLEMGNEENNRGYWDVVWKKNITDKLQATKFKVITARPDQAEISFLRTYDVSIGNGTDTIPLTVDKRYILQRGSSGFYAYAIFERLEGWPGVQDMDQIRMVYKLEESKFHYMALTDTRQRMMPTAADRDSGQKLAYKEAVLLTNPSNPDFRGEVDDKYQYSIEDKDNKVHGWISTDESVGFWMITPSDEFRTGGPFKQDLTSHVGPTTLSMFVSTHYAGKELGIKFEEDEAWKKVFGPVFVYMNSAPSSMNSISKLWNDAKQQLLKEVKRWPYSFIRSEDFPTSDERGSVFGQLLIHDRYINESLFPASSAYVGLAAPGEVGSWQRENKGYQFWNQTDEEGNFIIKDVRPGNYSFYAWVPGIVGDYKYEADITITPGCNINLNNLTYEPPRNGPTLWEIGIPDRTAAEFYVPDPYPTLLNKLYDHIYSENFRQYGLWARYGERYPHNDLVYTVGVDNYWDDWFYAQVTRNTGDETYVGTTWQVLFDLQNVTSPGNYTLQLALASANSAELQVRINNQSEDAPHFTTKLIGGDNAIARHGIHGLYWLFSIEIPCQLLKEGNNTIYLSQTRGGETFQGVMYDYIRLEAPSPHTADSQVVL